MSLTIFSFGTVLYWVMISVLLGVSGILSSVVMFKIERQLHEQRQLLRKVEQLLYLLEEDDNYQNL